MTPRMPMTEPDMYLPEEPYLLADHPVLDFLNTVACQDGKLRDYFHSDGDVLRWLNRVGWPPGNGAPEFVEGELLAGARLLRESLRELITLRKEGRTGDPWVLNRYLSEAPSYFQLRWAAPEELAIERIRQGHRAECLLAPIAEGAAELLVRGDFSLIRRCQHPECRLWFYDKTKSRRRRWCSMALCGNRHKVASFRKRQESARLPPAE